MNVSRRGAKSSVKSMDELKANIIDSTIDLYIPCNPTGSEITTGDIEQTVDADATINQCGASSDSVIDDSTPNDAINNTDANNDAAINKAKDASAAQKLLSLHSVIVARTKYEGCVAYLTCLKSGKLEDASFACVNGECPTCGFDKIWSKVIRRRLFIREFDSNKSEQVEKLNPNLVLATDIWMNKLNCRGYETKYKPSAGAHIREVNRQATAASITAEA